MTLLNPLALGLAALALPIVAMYMLKLRRQEKVVSSTFLWRRAVDDLQANAPWQRLRLSWLLIAQLLAVAALVLSLAAPAYSSSRTYAGDLVLIVDSSYGMSAHDVTPSRFELARREARTLAGQRSSGSVVSVIGMGSQPALGVAESDDDGAIGRAIDNLHLGTGAPNVLGALTLAASLSRSGTPVHAVLLTSRESGIVQLPISLPFPLQIVRIGGKLRDLGITAFATQSGAVVTRALLRVSNFGASHASSAVELKVDGRLADVRPVSLAPGAESNLIWDRLPAHARVLSARITGRDDVDTDKAAWTVTNGGDPRKVLLVTSSGFFLRAALQTDPSARLSLLKPGNYRPALARGYDLVVFDGWLPPVLPPGPALLAAPSRGSVSGITFGAQTTAGAPEISSDAPSGLVQYVDVSDVHVAVARTVRLPVWLAPAIAVHGTTLLAAGDHNGTRVAVLPFDLADSDWPLRIGFPVLVHNLLDYLAPGLTLGAASISAGDPVQLSAPVGVKSLTIRTPDGATETLIAPFAPYSHTSTPGLYHVSAPGSVAGGTFAVNFFPSRPAPATGPRTEWVGAAKSGPKRSVSVPVSLSWAFAGLVLALLSGEWWLAYRR